MVRTTTKVVRVARADIQGMGVYVVDKSIRLTTDRSSDYNLCLALTETHDNRMASHQRTNEHSNKQPQGAQPTSKSAPLATATAATQIVSLVGVVARGSGMSRGDGLSRVKKNSDRGRRCVLLSPWLACLDMLLSSCMRSTLVACATRTRSSVRLLALSVGARGPSRSSSSTAAPPAAASSSLLQGSIDVLCTPDAHEKAAKTRRLCEAWRARSLPFASSPTHDELSQLPLSPPLPARPPLVRFVPDHKKRTSTAC